MPFASNVSFKRGPDTLAGQWHALSLGHVWVPRLSIAPFFGRRLHGLSPCTLLFFLCLEIDVSRSVLPQLLAVLDLCNLLTQRSESCVIVCNKLSGPREVVGFYKMHCWMGPE